MTTIIRLDPSIPLDTPKGPGNAILYHFLGEEHNALWTVIIDKTGEIWTISNPYVRAQKNLMMERFLEDGGWRATGAKLKSL